MSNLNKKVRAYLRKSGRKSIINNNAGEIGSYLQKCIQEQIDTYYMSYTPTQYTRTNRFSHSLNDYELVQFPDGFNIKLSFNSNGVHVSNDGRTVFVPNLLDLGWQHSSCSSRCSKSYYYHNFNGFNFIEKGIQVFKARYPYIQVTVKRTDQWHGYSENSY